MARTTQNNVHMNANSVIKASPPTMRPVGHGLCIAANTAEALVANMVATTPRPRREWSLWCRQSRPLHIWSMATLPVESGGIELPVVDSGGVNEASEEPESGDNEVNAFDCHCRVIRHSLWQPTSAPPMRLPSPQCPCRDPSHHCPRHTGCRSIQMRWLLPAAAGARTQARLSHVHARANLGHGES